MTKSSSTSGAGHILSSRYATSLIEVAEQAGAIAFIEKDMQSLYATLTDSQELQAVLSSPVYKKEQQLAVVQEIAKKAGYHQLTANFLGVLALNGRLDALSGVLRAFFQEMARRHGVIEAKVVSAYPLSESQQGELVKTLSTKTGKSVRLDLRLDQSLLGGMVVTIGSRMIDDSLKTRLAQLKSAMIGNKAA